MSEGSAGAVEVAGSGSSISSLVINVAKMAMVGTSNDYLPNSALADAIFISSATKFTVNQVAILGPGNKGGGNDGIEVVQSSNGTISDVQISRIGNVSLQLWGCSNVQITKNVIHTLNGSPLGAGILQAVNQNVTISNNQFVSTASANYPSPVMQLSALNSSSFINNTCTKAAVSVVSMNSTGWTINKVVVSGNTITGVSPTGITVGYGGIMLQPATPIVAGVTVSNNTVFGTKNFSIDEAIAIDIQDAANTTISSNVINGTTFAIEVFACANTTLNANTVSNTNSDPILVVDEDLVQNTGSLAISANQLSICCSGTPGTIIRIYNEVSPTPPYQYASLSIINNNYAGPANQASYYINCPVPSAGLTRTSSGNTTSTLLPNSMAP